jgi:Ca2+-transporting ATPase
MNHLENKAMIGAFIAGLLLQVIVTEVPFLVEMFETASLTLKEWSNLILISMVPLLSHEIVVLVKNIMKK